MVAVGLMRKIEAFLKMVNTLKKSNHDCEAFRKVYLLVLGVIVYFWLPVHEDSTHIDSNCGCWTVPCAFLLTQLH
jgi:hypothetical protein